VRSFVDAVRTAALPPVHAVVCNAGLQVVSGSEKTAEGVEMTFGVNHLGHFALVQGLLDVLARPARIVVVSGGTHDPGKFTGMPAPDYTRAAALAEPTTTTDGAEGRRRYTTSKLCNVLFAYELDRRLGHGAQGITVTAFDPGLMPGSGLARDYSAVGRWHGATCSRCCACFPASTAHARRGTSWPRLYTMRASTPSPAHTSSDGNRPRRRGIPATVPRRSTSGRPVNGW
jgi:NAD(P)-dependent dehydrogenase (short-subunit alcohol dehydrogenase family)